MEWICAVGVSLVSRVPEGDLSLKIVYQGKKIVYQVLVVTELLEFFNSC